ncbi:MAG: PBP1A family penicillin-binding protein [Bdellovibrionales bacterium]|nr:PBP1A family penicillin-binding protein [Bdellovibrionales bacterium]
MLSSSLPQMITVSDYKPLLVSEVFDRKGEKIGEFSREKRTLVTYENIPKHLIEAFVAAEDSSFFRHDGLNYLAMVRAFLANLKAGRKVQGGSTITQQIARSLLLSSEKTYIRKIKEVILAHRMEKNLSKKEILYLYLNQIYLGQKAYGVEAASQTYFHKSVKDLNVAESALLAGLPQAPSRYSPLSNPHKAKERQRYVLSRMAEEGFISVEEAKSQAQKPVQIFVFKSYQELAPFYLETLRQLLIAKLGENVVFDQGIKIYTGLDLSKQKAAQREIQLGLRALDKRQGFRGAQKNLTMMDTNTENSSTSKVAEFLLQTRNELMDDFSPEKTLHPDGTIDHRGPLNLSGKDKEGRALPALAAYISVGKIVKAVVTKIDDKWGLVQVRFAENKGLIDFDTMRWARKPDTSLSPEAAQIKKPSEALKIGDLIDVRVVGKSFSSQRINKELLLLKKAKKKKEGERPDLPDFIQFAQVELEQEPISESALVSFDVKTGEIIALVGGSDFSRSQFNRALQALRQTGSAFKSLVYASALDKNYTPASLLMDVPLVYDESENKSGVKGKTEEGQDAESLVSKKWKPENHSKSFSGEVLFRNALIRSLNVPTVKLIENIGVDWVATYARRLGIFSPLNRDFTLALGSSGVTVYEMTKAFSVLANKGKRIHPLLIHRVVSQNKQNLLEEVSLDERFSAEVSALEKDFETRRLEYLSQQGVTTAAPKDAVRHDAKDAIRHDGENQEPPGGEKGDVAQQLAANKKIIPPIFFSDPDQVLKPQTAFVTTTLLQGVIDEAGGTGGAARALDRPVAGKTGSTSGYYDAWFIGYTPDIVSGVWVGFDEERSLGRGEVGGKAALPIWLGYMKAAHEGLPVRSFDVPEGIVFANIDNETGKLASESSKLVVRQAFIEGTEPQEKSHSESSDERQNFYREDL